MRFLYFFWVQFLEKSFQMTLCRGFLCKKMIAHISRSWKRFFVPLIRKKSDFCNYSMNSGSRRRIQCQQSVFKFWQCAQSIPHIEFHFTAHKSCPKMGITLFSLNNTNLNFRNVRWKKLYYIRNASMKSKNFWF